MRQFLIRIYEFKTHYIIKEEVFHFINKNKFIDFESEHIIESYEDLRKHIIKEVKDKKIRKAKINYIAYNIIIDVFNIDKRIDPTDIEKKINNLYLDYEKKYVCKKKIISNSKNNKKYLVCLIPIETDKRLKEICLGLGVHIDYYYDLIATENYLSNNKGKGKNKNFLYITNELSCWRFYHLNNDHLLAFFLYYEEKEYDHFLSEYVIDNIKGSYDKILLNVDYKLYMKLCERWKNYNLEMSNYEEQFKNLEEKKIIYQ